MIYKNGTVDKVARHGKAFTLVEDGSSIWYTAFAASQLNGCSSGDTVEFAFQESVKAGTTWNNIKNDVKVTGKGSVGTTVLPSSGGTPSTPAAVFGAMTLSKDRSIARQNACNVAAMVLAHSAYRQDFTTDPDNDSNKLNPDMVSALVLKIARDIEAYTTGDEDKAAALASLEQEGDED